MRATADTGGQMIETKQLQYFISCAELESFSKAAMQLNTTQPNVSKVIKTLEDELGIELFLRLKNGIELNDDGRKLYTCACEVMQDIQRIEICARQLRQAKLLKG